MFPWLVLQLAKGIWTSSVIEPWEDTAVSDQAQHRCGCPSTVSEPVKEGASLPEKVQAQRQ